MTVSQEFGRGLQAYDVSAMLCHHGPIQPISAGWQNDFVSAHLIIVRARTAPYKYPPLDLHPSLLFVSILLLTLAVTHLIITKGSAIRFFCVSTLLPGKE